jgi:MFS family permease
MGRTAAVVWHASFSIAAGVLYFFFVLPRWPELLGDTSHTLGTALRIVTGALIGLAALPVVFTLLRTRRPEFGTPQLALTLRTSSIALHVLAAALIIGTTVSEIWLSVDSAGQWLFGIYGAAAAIALLGIFAFYLAFVAELPPPPPKPLKPRKTKQGRRGRRTAAEEDADDEATSENQGAEPETESDEKPAEVTAEAAAPESTAEEPEPTAHKEPIAEQADDEASDTQDAPSTNGRLRNRRRRRLRGGVAVED